jgi:hypothetical protein
MRDHAIVSPQFWTGETGRQLRHDPDAQRIAFYLMTCPSANMIGLYYLPIPLICHEVGLSEEGALKGLARLSEALFCAYDAPSETVFVFNMARYQLGETLNPKDHRHLAVQRQLSQMRNSHFYNAFLEIYSEPYCLNLSRNTRGLQGASEPLRSKDQDKDKDKDKEKTLSVSPDGETSLPLPHDREQETEESTEHPSVSCPVVTKRSRPPRKEAMLYRCPSEFSPTPNTRQWAQEKYPSIDVDDAVEAMKDHEFTKPHTDWDATLKTWIRNECKYQQERMMSRRSRASPSPHPMGMTDKEWSTVQTSAKLIEEIEHGSQGQSPLFRGIGRNGRDVQ